MEISGWIEGCPQGVDLSEVPPSPYRRTLRTINRTNSSTQRPSQSQEDARACVYAVSATHFLLFPFAVFWPALELVTPAIFSKRTSVYLSVCLSLCLFFLLLASLFSILKRQGTMTVMDSGWETN